MLYTEQTYQVLNARHSKKEIDKKLESKFNINSVNEKSNSNIWRKV